MTDWWFLTLIVLVLIALLLRLAMSQTHAAGRLPGLGPVLAVGAGVFGSVAPAGGKRGRQRTEPATEGQAQADRPRAAVVVNPTKFDGNNTDKPRAEIEEVCRTHGWADPLWLETTEDDPGYGQTKQALAEGVDLVCALGGDGTVRIVGSALVGSGVPMGLLSGGTGNLLARNLSLPVTSLSQGMTVALTGESSPIDTGSLRLRRPLHADEEDTPPPVDADDLDEVPPVPGRGEGEVEDHVFLVMAGLGFDAEVMANAPEKLKKQMGWAAYLVSGVQRLRGPQFKVEVQADDDTRMHRRVRSVMVGNVGKLTGGLNLVPQARADDGILDLVLLSPEGLVGWGAVVTRLVTRSSRGHQRVDYFTAKTVEVVAGSPVEIQLDGDTLGRATAMSVTVNPGSLLVRLPRD
ncbi:diacylglycerol/lipid kinase family protein [Ornithinimicrobium cavernae]|uniref:diacylglycerol/lipid kinase family protein n=1 Tax=Ornithinimicrobium cavernae TaxID=2666047 RepID=UPI001F24ED6D|nr:diacylglycerol kinase family protein [Ornithinimicrobium cavernae]